MSGVRLFSFIKASCEKAEMDVTTRTMNQSIFQKTQSENTWSFIPASVWIVSANEICKDVYIRKERGHTPYMQHFAKWSLTTKFIL